MNKKGGDKIISVYWFAILFIVAGAVVYMMAVFYGNPQDVRDVEVNLLIDSVARCIVDIGVLKEEVLEKEFDLLNFCDLRFDAEDMYGWKNDQYFLRVKILDFETKGEIIKPLEEGNVNLEDFCGKGNKNPICVEKRFYSIYLAGEKFEVNIFGVVRKTEKNA